MAATFRSSTNEYYEINDRFTEKFYFNIMNIEEWPEEPNQSVLEDDGDNMTFYLALKNIILRFIPSSLALFIEYGILLSNIIFIATLGDSVLLSGAGLGVFTINIVIFWIDVGLWGGLDTLVSHSYGRKEYYLWGVYLNSSRIVIALLFIPQAILILNVRTFFVYINQPELSAEYAAEYALLLLPGIFFGMQFEWTRRFLLAQGVYMPILYTPKSQKIEQILNQRYKDELIYKNKYYKCIGEDLTNLDGPSSWNLAGGIPAPGTSFGHSVMVFFLFSLIYLRLPCSLP